MIKVLLDANIYDQLEKNPDTRQAIAQLINDQAITVMISRSVAEELYKSPFKGIPNFFPYKLVRNTVARAGLMCAGDSLGSGEVYQAHLGNSKKKNDALIVDAASWHADWIVSEDSRLRHRAQVVQPKRVFNYTEFEQEIQTLKSVK
ncbi:hypothetical protein [Uliginosibacterium gangwonense]|uniref:hypothetical protein n=1 Tax=Uliginosibacterium gangwonense TaxID=392736 RepID=UPI00036EEE18|nr:hypothetical protein [Uliginosibacterium gangwonense]